MPKLPATECKRVCSREETDLQIIDILQGFSTHMDDTRGSPSCEATVLIAAFIRNKVQSRWDGWSSPLATALPDAAQEAAALC